MTDRDDESGDTDNGGVLERLASLPTMAHPTASPSGTEIALYYDITGRNQLHVLDVETGELAQWSEDEVPRNARWFVSWLDDDHVAFHLDDDGNEQNDFHAISRAGEAEPILEMGGQVSIDDVGPDGDRLLVGSTRDGQRNLYLHTRSTGETTKITEYERAAGGGLFSPDGESIAYSTNEADVYENSDVYVADADGSDPRNLEIGETGAEASPADWHPDGRRLLVSDNTEDRTRAGLVDVETGDVRWYGDLADEENPQFVHPDGERLLVTRSAGATVVPVVYDIETGESREFDIPEGLAAFGMGGEYVLADGRVICMHTTPTRRPELLAYDLETDEYEVLLEAEYGDFESSDFADAEYFEVASDGVPETRQAAVEHEPYEELEIGALLYDSGERPSPLIVNPHGGPRARDLKRFDLYTQFLVSRGFSVLQVNYRGSNGRGREFVEHLYDDWGGAEQGDVATLAEHVLAARDWIDDERVVVFGGSYGGYSAYWQLVQYPDLYDAGIAWIGVSDLPDMYENTMPHFQSELMEKYLGTPEDNPELYEERSPTTHAGNLSAPLLIAHGVNDRRVPVSQARLFRDALDDAGFTEGEGADYEYVELGEEGHASSDIDQKIRMFEILDDFLDRRIGTTAPEAAADD